jgi:hypothetical protein
MNNEQGEEAELLGVTLDSQLCHIDKPVVKMGRGMSVIKMYSACFTQRSTVLVV